SAAYDAALRERGSLTVWFADEAVAAWKAEPRTTRGGQDGCRTEKSKLRYGPSCPYTQVCTCRERPWARADATLSSARTQVKLTASSPPRPRDAPPSAPRRTGSSP